MRKIVSLIFLFILFLFLFAKPSFADCPSGSKPSCGACTCCEPWKVGTCAPHCDPDHPVCDGYCVRRDPIDAHCLEWDTHWTCGCSDGGDGEDGGPGDTTKPICGIEIEPSYQNVTVRNNSFEQGEQDWSGWNPGFNSAISCGGSIDGQCAASFWSHNKDVRVSQEIPVNQGYLYRLSAWGRGEYRKESDCRVYRNPLVALDAVRVESDATNSWVQPRATFLAMDSSATVQIGGRKGGDCDGASSLSDLVEMWEVVGANSAASNNVKVQIGIWEDREIGTYRIRNQGDAWSDWRDFSKAATWDPVDWTLNDTGTVEVQVRDWAQNESDICSDTINFNNPPEVISLSPTLAQTCPGSTDTFKFKTVYKDLDGLGDIRYAQLIIDINADWVEDPYPYFRGLYTPNDVVGWDEPTAGRFYLYQSSNTRNWGWGGGAKSGYFQNGYLRFDIDQSSVSWNESQKQLIITWAVKFRNLFPKGIENTYLYVEDMRGAQDTIPETSPSNIEIFSGFSFHKMGRVDTRCGTISGVTYQSPAGTTCANITSQPRLGWVTVKADLVGDGFEQTTSDGSGFYDFTDISAGAYQMSASKTGWTHVLTCNGSVPVASVTIPPDATQIYLGLSETKDAWFQTEGGDVHAQGEIIDPIPETAIEPYCSLRGDGGYPGVITYGTNCSFDNDLASEEGWLAKTSGKTYWYRYFDQLLPSDRGEFTGDKPSESGIYQADEDRMITSDWTVDSDESLVIFVNGSLTIESKINVVEGGFLAFIVKEEIKIEPEVAGTEFDPALEGIYVADVRIVTGSSAKPFRGEGMFIAGGFSLGRNLGTKNNTTPAEEFVYRPDLWINTPQEFGKTSFTWQEIAP